MIKAIIFDVDGTLVDSIDLHAQAWKDAFKRFGKEVPFEEIRAQIGKGADPLLPVFFSKEELKSMGGPLEGYRAELFRRAYLPRVRPFPKVRELFRRLKGDGKLIWLASSAKEEEVRFYKDLARIEALVDGQVSADEVENSKPCPDVFQAALIKLKNLKRNEMIAVGDTPYDSEGAGKAGLETIGFLCGGFSLESLRTSGCIAIYHDPEHLLANYEESPLATRMVGSLSARLGKESGIYSPRWSREDP